jgi:hypothetical protein
MSKVPKPKTNHSKDPVSRKKTRRRASMETCEMSREEVLSKANPSKEPVSKKKKPRQLASTETCQMSCESVSPSVANTLQSKKAIKGKRSGKSGHGMPKKKFKLPNKTIDGEKTCEETVNLQPVSPLSMERIIDEKSGDKKQKLQEKTAEEKTTETKTSDDYNEELLNNMSKALTFHSWFHGLMPREEIAELLMNDGDFLVRKTEVARQVRYAVTVMHSGRIRHILLNYKNDMWSLRDLKKTTVTELIETYVNEKIPVMLDGAILINAVPRPAFYILHEHVELKNRLGGGAFGDVYKANLKNKDGTVTPVAAKQLKGAMLKKQRSEFIKEAKLMRRCDHPNIIKIYGIAPQEEPILILLELAANGSLTSKLQGNPGLDTNTLMRYTTDAARGMCYLSGRKVIHRDIAARNCLLGAQDEVKISDFGMSVADKSMLKLDKLNKMPVRWLSPEIMRKGEFTTKSDVWAFGVLVWEIFARCKSDPFPQMTNKQAKDKILSGKQPMEAPDGSPELIKSVMMLCFIQNPDERPDFERMLMLLSPKEIPPPKIPDFETYTV